MMASQDNRSPMNRKKSAILESGSVAGNYFDKYNSRNPVVKYLMSGFYGGLHELLELSGAKEIHEVGCGEGYLATLMTGWDRGLKIRASDHSAEIIEIAKRMASENGIPVNFFRKSVYDMDETDSAELIVCCEVLEHLEEPERVLKIISGLARPYLLVSVPREPIWRIMNLARGKYLSDLGNTPGHIQHFSRRDFLSMLERNMDIVKVLSPLPWTMALCRAR
jgi:2-polyprenyl-3-methyl-5-hydroxy-6-metoxy-1,4-benzoquinol methylase